jgi:hypothetical protein
MKKILAGILFAFLTIGSCFAEFNLKTCKGYLIFWQSQTIEETTLFYGINNYCQYLYTKADGTTYNVDVHPHSWPKDRITEKSVTLWAAYDCEEKSMRDALTSYIKEAEDNYGREFPELLKKIETMKFEDE